MAVGLLAFSLLIVLASPSQGATQAQVSVTNFGRVNGFQQTQYNKKVNTYLGIPFARPPTGNLRFRPPQPLPPPDDATEYSATELPATCYQTRDTEFAPRYVDMWNPNTDLSEDCLYLNIWQPDNARNRPVMVWIYGGGFFSGTSTLKLYDGAVLAARGDLVVVSMQYRIGPLGFLSLGTESAPGNAGLLDQQMAMRWVHEHIADFGGDPQRVTIFGESAGAASVGYHLLSPGSDDFFRSAIMQSASPVGDWAFVEPEEAKKRAYKLAELVGCSRDNTIECLQKQKPDVLTNKQWDVPEALGTVTRPSYFFVPTIDHKFLKKSPLELLKSGEFQRKNILLGMNSHEGSFCVIYAFKKQFDPEKAYNDKITYDEYREMVSNLSLGVSLSDVAADTIAAFYLLPCSSEGNTGDSDAGQYLKSLDGIFGDVWIKCPVVHMAKSYARKNESKVYVYAFNHRTTGNPWPAWSGDALHGFEIDHVFGVPYRSDSGIPYNSRDRRLSGHMMTYWTNFAKTGNPNDDGQSKRQDVVWPEYTADDRQVLVLDAPDLTTQRGLRDRYCQFWSKSVPQLLTATGQASAMDGSTSLLLTAAFSFIAVLLL